MAAVREHAANAHPEEDLTGITYRDDFLPQSKGTATVDTASPHSHAAALAAADIPVYGFAAWPGPPRASRLGTAVESRTAGRTALNATCP